MEDNRTAEEQLRDVDKDEWVAAMSEHVKKLGLEDAVHDYVKTLGTQS